MLKALGCKAIEYFLFEAFHAVPGFQYIHVKCLNKVCIALGLPFKSVSLSMSSNKDPIIIMIGTLTSRPYTLSERL